MRRSTLLHILLAAVTVLSLASCTYNRLKDVEKAMEADVQSADSMLNAIDPPSSGRSLALYSLLKTQIDYKLYRDIPTDSVIKIATDFYGSKRKDYHAAMAWYSLGCISGELGQDSTAADAYLTAMRTFPDTLVRYYALTEQNLGKIYLEHSMYDEAINLINSCRGNSVRLSDSAAIAFCDYCIAKYLLYRNEYQAAKDMFLELKENKWLASSTRNNTLIQLAKIALVHSHDYTLTLDYTDAFLAKSKNPDAHKGAYSIKADAFYNLNRLDSAIYYYRLSFIAPNNPSAACNSCRRLAEVHSALGNQDSVVYYTKLASKWMDAVVATKTSEPIPRYVLNNSGYSVNDNGKSHIFLHLVLFCFIIAPVSILLQGKKKPNCDNNCNSNNVNNAQTLSDFWEDIDNFKKSEMYEEILAVVSDNGKFTKDYKIILLEKYHGSLLNVRSFLMSRYGLSIQETEFCFSKLLGIPSKPRSLFFDYSESAKRTLKYRVKNKLPQIEFDYIFKKK